MHVPGADSKMLSLKILAQKCFEIHIIGGCVRIMKADKTYMEALLGKNLYEVKMKIVPQDNVPERRQKILEVSMADRMKRPEHHITQEISEEVPITNTICDVSV